MDRIARASTGERRLVFEAAAQRMALAPAVVEKDFWVCYTLDHLFHRSGFAESMVFKGGTSLSKAFGLIERFSEDIDLILDWQLLGYGENEPWEPRSNSAQERFKADSIERANAFLADAFVPKLRATLSESLGTEASVRCGAEEETVYFDYPRSYESAGTLDTIKQNDYKIAEKKINATFGETNQVVLIFPFTDFESEASLLDDLNELKGVDHIQALAGEEAKDGYMVTDSLTPRKFAELTDIDIGVSRALYTAYCTANDDYTKALGQLVDLSNIDNCSVPLIDMFKFLYEQRDIYRSKIDAETMNDLEEMYDRLIDGEKQLHSEHYSRMILYLNLPVESEETYDYLTVIKGAVGKYYDESYFVGETAKDKDFSDAFSTDNTLISILTVVFVILVLLVTFKSVALPLLLILVIQGSVWINFSFPTLLHNNLYFLAYLIVSAIMMGANIDYAIVISSRYLRLKEEMPYKEAMIEALNQAFPTVVTSGTILAAAGMSIGFLSSENTVASIGICLGRGTLISMVLVMCVLPQILLLGDSLVEKTSFTIGHHAAPQHLQGAMRVNGHVRGYINGYVDAEIHGRVNGTVSASIDIGNVQMEEAPAQTVPAADLHGEEGSDEKT